MSTSMMDAALSYVERGFQIIPLHTLVVTRCSCGRPECDSPGKHPRTRNGLKDATNDREQIKHWWSQWSQSNVGIITGAESGLVVVDLDGDDGEQSLAALTDQFGDLPVTLTAKTGRGRHLYFAHPGIAVRNSAGSIGRGIDVRGERGYVVAPPSKHASGTTYEWQPGYTEISEMPSWLVELANSPKESVAEKPISDEAAVAEGKRNDTLYKLACSLRGQMAMERPEIMERLFLFNRAKCDPPLDEDEVERIATSACQHPAETGGKKSLTRTERNPLYWFKMNVRDFQADQNLQIMSDQEIGWWMKLRASAWLSGGTLPADDEGLWKLAGAKSKKTFEKKCGRVLAEYQRVSVGGVAKLMHKELAPQYANTLEKWLQAKAAGEANRERLRAIPTGAEID